MNHKQSAQYQIWCNGHKHCMTHKFKWAYEQRQTLIKCGANPVTCYITKEPIPEFLNDATCTT